MTESRASAVVVALVLAAAILTAWAIVATPH
jgi:hypothetical protein